MACTAFRQVDVLGCRRECQIKICFDYVATFSNFGLDCEEDWAKAKADAIADYKEINGGVDVRGARFVRVCFI
jgi:hypothetical protein